jgi:hypothetical protein
MNTGRFLAGWGRILAGMPPMLSIEITRECPLRCPGCYAYEDQHLGGSVTLRQLSDLQGDALVRGVLDLVARHRPVHLSHVMKASIAVGALASGARRGRLLALTGGCP